MAKTKIVQEELNIPEKNTGNISRVELLNMKNTSQPLNELTGSVVIQSAAIVHDKDDDGNPLTKGFIIAEDGSSYGTVSPTAIRCLDDAIDCIIDGLKLKVTVVTATSKSDREFITLRFEEVK